MKNTPKTLFYHLITHIFREPAVEKGIRLAEIIATIVTVTTVVKIIILFFICDSYYLI